MRASQPQHLARSDSLNGNSGYSKAVLYGASYYHEYMPYERLEKDIALMKNAGINVVRMGESAWSVWEPQDGHFEFEWMDRVVEAIEVASNAP